MGLLEARLASGIPQAEKVDLEAANEALKRVQERRQKEIDDAWALRQKQGKGEKLDSNDEFEAEMMS